MPRSTILRRSEAGTRHQGTLPNGMPYLRVGGGRPLVFLPGLTANHKLPTGIGRRFEAMQIMPFADHRRTWWINRRPGLTTGATMADLAGDYADALRHLFSEPVDVIGLSTGGSVALQLAADHPDLVRRLVVASAAHRLGALGRLAQRRVAEAVQSGDPRRAGAEIMRLLAGPASRLALAGVGWMLGTWMYGGATSDMVTTIHAEDGFDLRDRLHEITAPTLIVAGDRDGFYSPELYRETAALIPNSHLLLREGKGHSAATGYPGYAEDVLAFFEGRDIGRPASVARGE